MKLLLFPLFLFGSQAMACELKSPLVLVDPGYQFVQRDAGVPGQKPDGMATVRVGMSNESSLDCPAQDFFYFDYPEGIDAWFEKTLAHVEPGKTAYLEMKVHAYSTLAFGEHMIKVCGQDGHKPELASCSSAVIRVTQGSWPFSDSRD